MSSFDPVVFVKPVKVPGQKPVKPPVEIGVIDTSHHDPEETFMSLLDYAVYTPVFNATGQPSISLPLHQSEEGLPIGMMFSGRYGDEERL